MTHQPINFGPFANNIFDFVGRKDLKTSDGRPVRIKQNMQGWFVVEIGGVQMVWPDNLSASAHLNRHEVGIDA